MAFLYGLLRAMAAALRLVASAQHARAKNTYESLEQSFQSVEAECKAHEVTVGRPVDYNAQLQLLKAFEAKDKARMKWIRSANRLEVRTHREQWLKEITGKKLPYSFGVVDMALVMHTLDKLGLPFGLDVVSLIDSVRSAI